ncbi:ubiquinone biosynthesis protein [Natronincola peptidivorans]|uniref:Ubiquinone biosynthesis protein n=1 Tax=Natronincola peptidivorans TaxID=426128 RepID=A0A1H9YWR0_9FIRM|nr:AarF/UbiB family protein [Natronincola peptidivorans]SES73551.1 ubiquinone biosynthesis protein [Natronincola peptidivorans]
MSSIGTKYKNLKRYKKIGEVLVKYGFTFAAEKLIEKGYIPKFILNIKPYKKQLTDGEKLRMACEDLGPTFIKLGQIISTRRDIFPEEIVNQLSKLQDEVKPFPFEVAKEVFEKEMKINLEDSFKNFERVPMASASIGQVYQATLKTGENVVVKIQRPYIKAVIERDLDILYNLARLLDEHMDKEKPYNLMEIVDEFSYVITRELDYSLEGRNAEKFYSHFKNDKDIHIPKVYWDYTSKKVLTLERIYGVKIMDINSIKSQKWDLEELATISAHCFMKQVFIYGFFHGDPHPGNIFAVGPKKISFIDFGIVGYLDKGTMSFISSLFTAATRRDVEKIVNILMEIDAIGSKTNIRRLKEDISFLINLYYNMPLNKLNLGEALKKIMETAYSNNVKLPSQFTVLLKAIVTFEGSVKYLNPEFSLSNIAKDFATEIYLHRLNPKNLIGELKDYSEEILYGIKYLPKQIRNLLKKVENNEIKFQLEQIGFDKLQDELNRMTNKLSLSLISSALIVGSSLIIQNTSGPMMWGISVFGIIGYVLASILGVGIIISILLSSFNKK